MTRIVRQVGKRSPSRPRNGKYASMFVAESDDADSKAFVERCEPDRHHFRFTVSPEERTGFHSNAEQDLGTRVDWVAVDQRNTDNSHIQSWFSAAPTMARTW
jgi:type IV secretory pathway VirD2 relaxase